MFSQLQWWWKNRTTVRPDVETLWDMLRHPETISGRNTNNLPERFGRPELQPRSALALELVSRQVGVNAHILELGPSVGRNLAYLFDHGYRNLAGVEINEEALELAARLYPKFFEHCGKNLRLGPMEKILPDFEDGSFDVTFSLSVLQMVHDTAIDDVVDEIARVTSRWVITIEDELTISDHHFPRDYRKAFKTRGFSEVYRAQKSRVAEARLIPAFEARIFQRID